MLSASPAGEVRNILPYLFTGRRVDFLDNGSLMLQYNRHRYYDYYTRRWTTQDPLGMSLAPHLYDRCKEVRKHTRSKVAPIRFPIRFEW